MLCGASLIVTVKHYIKVDGHRITIPSSISASPTSSLQQCILSCVSTSEPSLWVQDEDYCSLVDLSISTSLMAEACAYCMFAVPGTYTVFTFWQ